MSKNDHLRLFVAVEIPEQWKLALAAEARALDHAAPGFGRWVDPALMHLTLVFLGSQVPTMLDSLCEAVNRAAAASRPFTLSLDKAGTFGSPRSLRVVWVSAHDSPAGALGALRKALVRSLLDTAVPFEAEIGEFRPHLTLGRARRDATTTGSQAMFAAISHRQAQRAAPWPEAFECTEIALIRSDLRPTGPIYTPVHHSRLDFLNGRDLHK